MILRRSNLSLLAFGFWLLASRFILGQAPQFDTYGGLVGLSCPLAVTPGYQPRPRQFHATSTTSITTPGSNTITLSGVTESDGTALSSYPTGTLALDIDPGSTTPVNITGETPTGGTWGTACNSNYPAGYRCYTGYLAHASALKPSVVVQVSGVTVATENFGAIESNCSGCAGLGAVTGHVSLDLNDTGVWVSLAFSSTPAAPPTINYSYLPTEVVKLTGVAGNTITATFRNAHTAPFVVMEAYFRTAKSGNRWLLCDPLNRAFFPLTPENWATDSHFAAANGAINTVNTAITQAINGNTSRQTVTVGSTSGIVAGPGMMLRVGRKQSDNPEWIQVTAVGAGTIDAVFKNSHKSGDSLECCQHNILVNGSSGVLPNAGGKYANDATWGSLLRPVSNYWIQLNQPRFAQYGFNSLANCGANCAINANAASSVGFEDLPDHTMVYKEPYDVVTLEASNGMSNTYGYAPDIVLDGDHGRSGALPDFFDPNMFTYAASSLKWFTENPWLFRVNPTQTDNQPTFGEGEHYTTTPQLGFNSVNTGKWILNAPLYISAPRASMKNVAAADANPNGQRGTFLSKKYALPQFLQGKFDPISFPTAASGTNITSLSCSGSNVLVGLSTAWLGQNSPPNGSMHFDPFTVGDIVTVSGTAHFNTSSGVPAQVTTAAQGSHQVTLQYPVSPCPNAAESSGLIALGPGYQLLADLNGSTVGWATNVGGYSTWGSSGRCFGYAGCANAAAVVSCSGTSCSVPVTSPIDPYSIQIVATCDTSALPTPCPAASSFSGVVAEDLVSSPSNWLPPTTASTAGILHSQSAFSTTVKTTFSAGSSVTFALNSNAEVFPGVILYFSDGSSCSSPGSNPEYVQVSTVKTAGAQQTTDSITGAVATFEFGHAAGTAVCLAFPTVAASAFAYNSGLRSIAFTIAQALPTGWALSVNYSSGGWANGGTGLMDEDGRCGKSVCTQNTWTGNDVACIDQGTGANAGVNCQSAQVTYGNAAFQRDIDGLAQAAAAYYQRNYLEQARAILPHMLVPVSYRNSGGKGSPSRSSTLRGQAPFSDLGFGEFIRFDNALPTSGAQQPCITGGAWGLCPDPQLSSTNWVAYYAGDEPIYDFMETDAEPDSAMAGFGPAQVAPTGSDYATNSQVDRWTYIARRLKAALSTTTINGSYQFVGADWWAVTDTPIGLGASNFGPLSVQDNLYNGIEDCNSPPNPEDVAGYNLTSVPEVVTNGNSCWGDFLRPMRDILWSILNQILGKSGIKAALSNASIQGAVTH